MGSGLSGTGLSVLYSVSRKKKPQEEEPQEEKYADWSYSKVQDVMRIFRILDSDKSGYIDHKELMNMDRISGHFSKDEIVT